MYWTACFLYDSITNILKIDADEILLQNYAKKNIVEHVETNWTRGKLKHPIIFIIIYSLELGDELKFFVGIQITAAYLCWHLDSCNIVSWKLSN